MEEKEFDYINVIPLVDVMLVLLTIVLTTSSFIATGMIPLDLPKVVKSQGEMLKTQTVEIDRQGVLFFQCPKGFLGRFERESEGPEPEPADTDSSGPADCAAGFC